jgi:hypothetical protein
MRKSRTWTRARAAPLNPSRADLRPGCLRNVSRGVPRRCARSLTDTTLAPPRGRMSPSVEVRRLSVPPGAAATGVFRPVLRVSGTSLWPWCQAAPATQRGCANVGSATSAVSVRRARTDLPPRSTPPRTAGARSAAFGARALLRAGRECRHHASRLPEARCGHRRRRRGAGASRRDAGTRPVGCRSQADPRGLRRELQSRSEQSAHHVLPPAIGFEMATITDFNGVVGAAEIQGTARGSDDSHYAFDTDMRFMQGVYVGTDGRLRQRSFAFI